MQYCPLVAIVFRGNNVKICEAVRITIRITIPLEFRRMNDSTTLCKHSMPYSAKQTSRLCFVEGIFYKALYFGMKYNVL